MTLFSLFSFHFLGTTVENQFSEEVDSEGENDEEEGDDVEEEVLVPGELGGRAPHAWVVGVAEQVLQPPHCPVEEEVRRTRHTVFSQEL